MKLVYPHDVPRIGVVRTFRHSRLAPAVTFLLVGGATAFWIYATLLQEDRQWIHWLPAVLGALMCLVILIYLRKSLKPTNWLLRVTEDGLFIKFRSYLNDGFPETTPTIVHIPYADIEQVRLGRRALTLPDRDDRTTTSILKFLELDLRHDATGQLADALRSERAMRPVRNGAAKHHDYPLRVTAPDQLRLEWKARPGLDQARETLQRFVSVDPNSTATSLDWARLDDAEKDAMIVELAELGERIRARRLAQEHYNLEKHEAKTYISKISGSDD